MKKDVGGLSLNRRDLLKAGLVGIGASALALSGCDKDSNSANSSDELKITPKQTGIYEFSCPLPFNYKTIDEIAELNSTLKKSKVTSFYNNAPNWNHNNWVSISRAKNDFIKTYDDFFKYVKYAQDKGFEFDYLMNSPKSFSENDISTFGNELMHLLDLFVKHRVENIKVANTQVVQLIGRHNKLNKSNFNLHASTAFEFHSVSEYEYLLSVDSNFKLFDISNDENQNFKFLKTIRSKFPNIKLELMVNEGCLKHCPGRLTCIAEDWAVCQKIYPEISKLNYFLKTGVIFPWHLPYYSAIGINNFKYISSTGYDNARSNFHNISNLKAYLNCIENGTDKVLVADFFANIFPKAEMNIQNIKSDQTKKNMKLSEIKHLFPDIRYFVAHGHECSTRCGVDCNYCYECAKKIEKALLYS